MKCSKSFILWFYTICLVFPCDEFNMENEDERQIRKFLSGFGFNGVQNSFVLKLGKVTVMRLVEDRCDYHIVYLRENG